MLGSKVANYALRPFLWNKREGMCGMERGEMRKKGKGRGGVERCYATPPSPL